jgi:hypothetical protein
VCLPFKHESYVLFLSYGLETPCFRYFPLSLPVPLSCTFTVPSFWRPLSFSYSVYVLLQLYAYSSSFNTEIIPVFFYNLLTHRISTVLRRTVYLKRRVPCRYFMWKILSFPDPVPLRAQAVS